MLRPNGFTFETDLDGRVIEGETFMCTHCNRHTAVKPRQRPEDIGGHCPNCFGLICPRCVATMHAGGTCVPLNKWLEQVHENWRKMQDRCAA